MTNNDFAMSSDADSDEELLELYAAGKLKPGLNIPVNQDKKFINNVDGLKETLSSFQSSLPWSERLDIVAETAPLAPELSMEITEQQQFLKAGKIDEVALNDFKRETMFHRQAQTAVMCGIELLHKHSIPTHRPQDYFAEMFKSDKHMQKVRHELLQRKVALEQTEKVRRIRQEKKLAKEKRVAAVQEKHKQKRDLNENIKKFRKGLRTDLDFLEADGGKKNKKQESVKENKKNLSRSQHKRKGKDVKYGFGGKKRGMKNNTTESTFGGSSKSKGKNRGSINKKKRMSMKNK
ncbi:probable rRNA-processing protein EBP2 homolog [Adelges cooleyi]|uniref:probable rRNA-processing protein EBP2 homolog n=1 Tax=Adelges cooleyi TaxID=133065 RepID=UPI00217FBD5D|nr:probable rRNA-processing protein EBP2 homolog [Adelges cooleyi]